MAKRSEDKIIGSIKKRDDSEIRATLTRFRNETYIDLREYVKTETYDGPTKRGIRFHVENWDGFKGLITLVDGALQEETR